MKNTTLLVLFCLLATMIYGQKSVGVVLSGGGASGVAHVGVLKALEESGIKIDYIAGTSSGALIGGLYAAGYTPKEIEEVITNIDINELAKGNIESVKPYFFMKEPDDASWVSLNFDIKDIINSTLPTNLVQPSGIDMILFKYLSLPSAAAGYNFDSLMIPFRCVASDIENKEEVVFCGGNLSTAVRTSITYPFYLKPIMVNDKLLFDGGLYNNFPIDVMSEEFKPDYIIGSNVSSNEPPPDQDNIISQVKNMMVRKSHFRLESPGVIIEPKTSKGLFDFEELQEVIDSGYVATMRELQRIKEAVSPVDSIEINQRRKQFTKSVSDKFEFTSLEVQGVSKRQKKYVEGIMRFSNERANTMQRMEHKYYRLALDDKIDWVYPTAVRLSHNNAFSLKIHVKKKKPFNISFGGNFSTRPINTGFVGIKAFMLGKTGLSVYGNTYFGKLYGSIKGGVRWDIPTSLPLQLGVEGIRNRWNYFQSQTSFLNDQTPTYLIQKENIFHAYLRTPINNVGAFKLGWKTGNTIDEYYQTLDFSPTDVPDITNFNFRRYYSQVALNTLDRKQYPSKGYRYSISASYITGQEFHQPGSTANLSLNSSNTQSWLSVQARLEQYFNRAGRLRFGLHGQAVLSTQKPFNNYTSNVLRLPFFQPNPESKTLFLESFRSSVFVAGGPKVIIALRDRLDLRLEGSLFQPIENYSTDPNNGSVVVSRGFKSSYTTGSASLVYDSPLGPMSVSVNYYYNVPEILPELNFPVTVFFHFGYVLFNERALTDNH